MGDAKRDRSFFSLAIASGKGGTGKTTIAVNMAKSLAKTGLSVSYFDCDVEEPNGHIFLSPDWDGNFAVHKRIPVVNQEKCVHCGKCSQICEFSAIVNLGDNIMVFRDLCHACGGCALVCPVQAIEEINHEVGTVKVGHSENLEVIQGELMIGEPSAVPTIKAVKSYQKPGHINILDCPPGTSCPVVESVHQANYVILITEPTPFGFHDFKLAVELLNTMNLPFGAIINRSDLGDCGLRSFCQGRQIPILLEIPDDRKIAVAYSNGQLAIEVRPELIKQFTQVFSTIEKRNRS